MAETFIQRDAGEDEPWFQLRRKTAQDERLTWEARGVLSYLLSLPSTWRIRPAHLIKQGPGGRDRMYRILAELVAVGYLRREAKREPDGQIVGYDYFVRMRPLPEKPDTAQPDTANTDAQRRENVTPTGVKGVPSLQAVTAEAEERDETTAAPSVQTYLGALVDYIRAKTGDSSYVPGPRISGMLAVELKGSLAAGASDEHIRAGCRHWADRDLHPRTLGSVIDQFRRGGRRRLMTKTGLEIADQDWWDQTIELLKGEENGQGGMGHPGPPASGVLPQPAHTAGNGGSVVA